MGFDIWDDMFGYDDFVGSMITPEVVSDEDRLYDPGGVTTPTEEELDFDDT
jgi:hypothetical protein